MGIAKKQGVWYLSAFVCCLIVSMAGNVSAEPGKSGWIVLEKARETVAGIAGIGADGGSVCVNSILENPGWLGFAGHQISITSENGYTGDTFGTFIYALPTRYGSIAAGGIYYDAGSIELNWIENNALLSRNVSLQKDTGVMLSYGRKLIDTLSTGITFKSLRSELVEEYSAQAYSVDIGFAMRPVKSLMFNIGLSDIGTASKYIAKESPLPTSLNAGATVLLKMDNGYAALLAGSAYNTSNTILSPKAGFELGYRFLSVFGVYTFSQYEKVLKAGMSIRWGPAMLGYSSNLHEYLQPAQHLNVSYAFQTDENIKEQKDIKSKTPDNTPVTTVRASDSERIKSKQRALNVGSMEAKNKRAALTPSTTSMALVKISDKEGTVLRRPVIAVVDFKGKGVPAANSSTAADFMRDSLVEKGAFAVVERESMDAILAEASFQASGCTTVECAAKIGKILNVEQIVVGSLSNLEDEYYLIARLVDVESAQILSSQTMRISSLKKLKSACREIAEKFSKR